MVNKRDITIVSILNCRRWLHLSVLYGCNGPTVYPTSARSMCSSGDETTLDSSRSNKERTNGNSKQKLVASSKNRKMTRSDAIARYREEKLIFGQLYKDHTARKTTKSLSEATKTPILPENSDPELSWMLKSPKNFRTIRLQKKTELDCDMNKADDKAYWVHSDEIVNSRSATLGPGFSLKVIKSTDSSASRVHVQDSDEMPPEIVTPEPDGKINDLIKTTNSFPIFYPKQSVHVSENSAARGSVAVENERVSKFPSVTKILRDTMSPEAKQNLLLWEKSMIEKLGVQGFDRYKTELMNDGKALHACIRNTLLREDVTVPTHIQPSFDCLKEVLQEIDDAALIESNVFHPQLQYKGIVDCVVTYRGERCVIDWKKSDKIKSTLKSTFDAPIQVAAYVGAINVSNDYPFTIEKGLVVVAHTSGQPAKVHEISTANLQKYWEEWLEKLRQYYTSIHTAKI